MSKTLIKVFPKKMSDNVPHKRQRVSKACDTCRRKKVKCDGVQPRCGNCGAFNFDCTYNDTTKKRGPPKGYIEAIETRLHRMESLLGGLVQSNDPRAEAVLAELMQDDLGTSLRRSSTGRPDYSSWSFNSSNSNSAPSPSESDAAQKDKSLVSSSSSMDSCENMNGSDGKSVEDLNEVMGVLSIDENNQVRYHGRSSGFYLLKKSNKYKDGVLRVLNQGSYWGPRQVVASNTEFELLKHPELTELPSKEIFEHLFEIYFTHIHPIIPIIYKPTFFNKLKNKDNLSHLLLNAIFALSSRYSDHSEIKKPQEKPETVGSIFFERAKALLDFEYDNSRLSTVQALILLSLRDYGTGKVSRAWMYAGMSIRMAQDMGLHRNTEKWDPINFSHEEKETRKRVFWGCFILDRISSANIGRPLAIDEQDVDASYPSEEEEDENELLPFKMDHTDYFVSSPIFSSKSIEGLPTIKSLSIPTSSRPDATIQESKYKSHCISHFNALVKLCEIIGRIIHNIYAIRSTAKSNKESVLSILDSSLTLWFTTLPAHLQYNPAAIDKPPSPVTITLHIMYYSILMLLHRPYLPATNQSHDKYTSAANSLTDLAEILVKDGTMQYTMNSTVYAIFMAGVLHTYNATQPEANVSQPAKANLAKCLKALEELKKTWVNAYKYSDLLMELADLKDVKFDWLTGKPTSRGNEKGEDSGHGSQIGCDVLVDNNQRNLAPAFQGLSSSSSSSSSSSATCVTPINLSSTSIPSPHLKRTQTPPSTPASSFTFTPMSISSFSPQHQQTLSHVQRLAPANQTFNHEFRYLSMINHDSQHDPPSMVLSNPYETNDISGDNTNNIPGTSNASTNSLHTPSSSGYWGIPPSADLAQWHSFMAAQQQL
ncbi:hypothetical protein G9A89_019939 [Geosiphon pyriformis]|nr:hypothetical protein G9A89_019939 [Geosiphon pyriformis]